MNFFEKILYFLSGTMRTPTSYGWFHIMFLAIVVLSAVLLCVFLRKAGEKSVRAVLLVCWGVVVLFECYKQLVFSINFDPVHWDYQWYAFPFQFCSSPLYVLPIAALAPHENVRRAARTFLATFSLFAGLAVMIYPNDVFVSMIGINVQTMVHHGSQVVVGVFLGTVLLREKKMNLRSLLGAVVVFSAMVSVAFALNLIVPRFTDETFNMFYIGPKYPCTLPVLSAIYPKIPYPLFLVLYTFGFSALAAIIFGVYRLIYALCRAKKGKKAAAAA